MGFIISSNKALLETIQLKIHNYMKANIPNYKADRWATVQKHQSQELFAVLIKESDKRLPYNAINESEKLLMVKELPNDFIKKIILGIKYKND